jgi:hypothetical protein
VAVVAGAMQVRSAWVGEFLAAREQELVLAFVQTRSAVRRQVIRGRLLVVAEIRRWTEQENADARTFERFLQLIAAGGRDLRLTPPVLTMDEASTLLRLWAQWTERPRAIRDESRGQP